MSSGNTQLPGPLSGAATPARRGPYTLAMAWRLRPVRLIAYFGILITAAVAAAGVYAVSNLRESALKDTERELQNIASVLSEHLERTFDSLTLTQLGCVQHIQALGISSVEEFEARMSGRDVHLLLRDRIVNLLPVHALLLASARGKVINYSRDWPVAMDDVNGEDYFEAMKSSNGLSSYIGVPTLDRNTGRWSFRVAYNLISTNGQFLGVIAGVMELRYFENLFATVDLGRGSSIALVRRDGRLLARFPQVDIAAAPSFGASDLFRNMLPRAGQGLIRVKSQFDQQERLLAGHNLPHHPAAVVVGMDMDTALAEWRNGAIGTIGIAIALVLVIGGMIILCARQVGKALNRQRVKLDTALHNMSNGLCMFDADGTLMVANERYREIFNIPPGLVEPGCKLRELLARLTKAGILGGDQDKYAADLMASLAAGKTTQYMRELRDGRTISITNRPLPGGGWVATHEDVTELKRREEALKLENMKLDVAMQNMSQGLVLFDSECRLIVCNQKYAELYRLPPELVKPGTLQKQILEHRLTSGIIAAGPAAQYVKDRTEKAKSTAPSDTILELSDGRTLLVALRPLANGGWVTTHEDITERRQAEAHIAHMAHHDALTNLPNRALLRVRLEEALVHVHRGGQLAVLYLDLDHFKSINDTLGHGIGDEMLKAVATRLRGCVRETDTIARLGGDEFAIIQTELEQPSDAAMLATRIRDALTPPYDLDGHQVPADVSIGISIAPSDATEPDQLLKNADMALYRAKADGRGTFRFFEPEMDERVKTRRTLELDLRKAVVNGEFELYFQPLVNLEHGEISGCEALLRWHHPTRGMVSPAEFIPVAEETGLINQIGEWVLRQACAEATSWPDNIAVAVNLSPVQFKNQGLAQLVISALAASGLPAQRLEIEITEAVMLQNNEATLATLHQLHSIGVRIAMDDFGTGYSSLSYLRSFPFDKIKIDRSFISDIADKDDSSAIVQAVAGLAGRLQMATTAEGVETEQQLEKIRALGCTEMQGYLYSRPLPAKDLARLLPPRRDKVASVA